MPFQYSDRTLRAPSPNPELAARPRVAVASASVGATMTADTALWSGSGNSLAGQWYRNNSAITNATNASHSVQSAGTYRFGLVLTSAVRNRVLSSADLVVA